MGSTLVAKVYCLKCKLLIIFRGRITIARHKKAKTTGPLRSGIECRFFFSFRFLTKQTKQNKRRLLLYFALESSSVKSSIKSNTFQTFCKTNLYLADVSRQEPERRS